MIASMQTYRGELVARREALDRQLGALDEALVTMGGGAAAPRRGPGRPRGSRNAVPRVQAGNGRRTAKAPREGSLKEYILKVLSGSGGVMAVKDISAGVLAAGFDTKNKTLAKSVGVALRDLRGVQQVGRGRFRLK
jgi:hypothetical protein